MVQVRGFTELLRALFHAQTALFCFSQRALRSKDAKFERLSGWIVF